MKKKVLVSLMCLSMIMSMGVGCSKQSNETSTDGESATTTTETPATEEVAATEEAAAETTEAAPEATEEVAATEEAATETVEAEEIPEALYHFTFDGEEDGVSTVVRTDDPGDNTGATYGIAEGDTYTDSDGNEQSVNLQYVDGAVGKCAYLDGNFGLKLAVDGFDTDDTYTISYWMDADRLATFGPTLQIGHNIGHADEDGVAWLNFTQTEWGTDSAKIFPVIWDRNSETAAWPWIAAYDDQIHGKQEWVLVTLVVKGEIYSYEGDTTYDLSTCDMYLNGQLVSSANAGDYGGIATGVMAANDNFECYLGINYWDTIFKGYVDDMYIFDEALTAGQVLSLYQLGDATVVPTAE